MTSPLNTTLEYKIYTHFQLKKKLYKVDFEK